MRTHPELGDRTSIIKHGSATADRDSRWPRTEGEKSELGGERETKSSPSDSFSASGTVLNPKWVVLESVFLAEKGSVGNGVGVGAAGVDAGAAGDTEEGGDGGGAVIDGPGVVDWHRAKADTVDGLRDLADRLAICEIDCFIVRRVGRCS